MFNRKRIIVAFGALALASGSAFGQAFADGTSDVTAMLVNVGTNSNGGTGSQIAETIFSMLNGDFNFLYGGPGSISFPSPGGGLIDSGMDMGNGLGWSFGGSNSQTGFDTTETGFSDASDTIGLNNTATEDTYNLVVYQVKNTGSVGEWFNLEMLDGVTAEVDLDNANNEYGQDEAILNFGYSNSQGAFTGNQTENTAYAFTGEAYGTDTFEYVENEINVDYKGFLKPGQTLYFAVQAENYSAVTASAVPGPAAAAPFFVGLLAAARRRKKA